MTPEVTNDLVNNRPKTVTKVYKKRWLILTIFISYALSNAFQWVQYSILTNIVTKYYNVTTIAVNWTSIIYMGIYPFIVIPVSYIVDTKGLRVTALIGGIGTALAAVLKVCTVRPDLFSMALLAQGIGSTAQVFIMCLPPKIAAVWFKPSELSLANSMGVFGSQLGLGLGLFIPSLVVKNSDDIDAIGADLQTLCWIITIYMAPVVLALIFCFPKQPVLPPSIAQAEERTLKIPTFRKFLSRFSNTINKPGMILQTCAYGFVIGAYMSFTTFLNQFVLEFFENSEEDAGRMGLLSVIAGMIGTILFGVFLDKTKRYKETNLFVCYMSVLSMLGMLGALKLKNMILTYLACITISFFANSYMATGIELAVELTFPSDESTATGILAAMAQVVGVIVTWALGPFYEKFGTLWSMAALAIILLIASLLTQIVPNIKNRQKALNKNGEKSDEQTELEIIDK